MLPARNRIAASLFKALSKGTIERGSFFDVRSSTDPTCNTYKVAVVVKASLFRSAVLRNKVRRKIYTAILPAVISKKGYFVVYPKKEVLYASLAQLEQAFRDLLY